MDGPAHSASESHDASRPVAQAADAVEGGVNARTVVTSKLTNLHITTANSKAQ
jgi:hypothetical protein